jgi:pSer/pThr/pTyr-binding forkhead associated (FHA) protein
MSEDAQNIRIGRGQGCDLVLTHESISRRHAELTIDASGLISIRDLNSSGGTCVLRGGKEIPVTTRTQLNRTDRLLLGDYEISIEDLLSLIEETGQAVKPEIGMRSIPPESPDRPKTRMVRCDCGTIKERGKPCPACGS